jgi:ectoine hydroxylase-related dioxygenase (phytanoyl-CoA dioxygenase family)
MASILTRGKNRLRRTAHQLAQYVKPADPGVQIDVEADARVIRDSPAEHFLWLDRRSSKREIERARRAGRITADEAALLGFWTANGYAVIERCIEPEIADAVVREVDRVWQERWHVSVDLLSGSGERTLVDRCPPESRKQPYKLNQLHQKSEAVRKIFMHPRIMRALSLIFGNEVVGVNSLTFEYGSQQTVHVDHVYMTPSPPRRMAAAWIALEDVRPDSGALEYWPQSHRLPPFKWSNPYPYHYIPDEQDAHAKYLSAQRHRFTPERFFARKGDVLLWHSMLAHGGTPIANPSQTRLSMACHYYSLECFGGVTSNLDRHETAWATRIPVEDPD